MLAVATPPSSDYWWRHRCGSGLPCKRESSKPATRYDWEDDGFSWKVRRLWTITVGTTFGDRQ